MTDQELAELAKGAEAMPSHKRKAVRARIPSWTCPEELDGLVSGIGLVCRLLADEGPVPPQLADLAAVAAADALHCRAEITRIREEVMKPDARAEMDRLDALITSGQAVGVPIDDVIREMEEWVAKNRKPELGKAG